MDALDVLRKESEAAGEGGGEPAPATLLCDILYVDDAGVVSPDKLRKTMTVNMTV